MARTTVDRIGGTMPLRPDRVPPLFQTGHDPRRKKFSTHTACPASRAPRLRAESRGAEDTCLSAPPFISSTRRIEFSQAIALADRDSTIAASLAGNTWPDGRMPAGATELSPARNIPRSVIAPQTATARAGKSCFAASQAHDSAAGLAVEKQSRRVGVRQFFDDVDETRTDRGRRPLPSRRDRSRHRCHAASAPPRDTLRGPGGCPASTPQAKNRLRT